MRNGFGVKVRRILNWLYLKKWQVGAVFGARDGKIDHSFYMFHALAREYGPAVANIMLQQSWKIRKTEVHPRVGREKTLLTLDFKAIPKIGRC